MSLHTLRDPTAETSAITRPRVAPPERLEGLTIALLDIGKARSSEFLDRIEARLRERGLTTRRYAKPTNAKVAPVEVIRKVASEAQAVLIALSDWGSCTSCSLHDLMSLDACGIPGVSVVTTEFRDAMDAQALALGFEPAAVYVPHPIQNRTREELAHIADAAIEPALRLLRAG